ncbi:MAG: TIGR04255 family protein [Pseudomonadota bacterium]
MTIRFKKPPINEVVMSTYFNPLIHGLRNEHIGLFWHSVKETFPYVSQHPPVGGMDITMGQDIFPMPRYWMIAADDINLIQIQKNAFMFNWRRREDDYPHYDTMTL